MPKPNRKPLDLREACVEQALAIIGESGLDRLSLREVARRLNVSHQAPYKHFPSRDHILAEVVRRAFAHFAAHLDARRPTSPAPADDLAAMGRAYLEYAIAHPLYYRLMFESPLPPADEHPAMMEQSRHAFSLLHSAIRRLPGHRPDPEMDAMFVWSVVHGAAGVLRSSVLDTLGLPAERIARIGPAALAGIGAALGLPPPEPPETGAIAPGSGTAG